MARKRKKRLRLPGLGRNFALRPGAGPHRSRSQKRAQSKLRREIERELRS
jgi:hypothetical protein